MEQNVQEMLLRLKFVMRKSAVPSTVCGVVGVIGIPVHLDVIRKRSELEGGLLLQIVEELTVQEMTSTTKIALGKENLKMRSLDSSMSLTLVRVRCIDDFQ